MGRDAKIRALRRDQAHDPLPDRAPPRVDFKTLAKILSEWFPAHPTRLRQIRDGRHVVGVRVVEVRQGKVFELGAFISRKQILSVEELSFWAVAVALRSIGLTLWRGWDGPNKPVVEVRKRSDVRISADIARQQMNPKEVSPEEGLTDDLQMVLNNKSSK